MDINDPPFIVAVRQIDWIDLFVTNVNAIMNALAFRALADNRRCIGVLPSKHRGRMQEEPCG